MPSNDERLQTVTVQSQSPHRIAHMIAEAGGWPGQNLVERIDEGKRPPYDELFTGRTVTPERPITADELGTFARTYGPVSARCQVAAEDGRFKATLSGPAEAAEGWLDGFAEAERVPQYGTPQPDVEVTLSGGDLGERTQVVNLADREPTSLPLQARGQKVSIQRPGHARTEAPPGSDVAGTALRRP